MLKKALYFPLTRIILALIVIVGAVALFQLGVSYLLDLVSISYLLSQLIFVISGSVLVVFVYIQLFRVYEKRRVAELSTFKLGKHILVGTLLGAGLQALTILVIYFSGGYEILDVNPLSHLLPAFMLSLSAAVLEELVIRGVIFRIMEEKLGSYIALVVSALLFGALHMGNPNSSLLAATGLALQAGVFLAAAYIYTRNLWFPIAIHFAWNFTQGGIFGAAVSGNSLSQSLFNSKIQGEEWYTGGAFGPEGSLQATVFCFSAALVLIYLSEKQNRIIRPFWKNRT